MMNSKIEKIKGFRLFLLKQIEVLSVDQLNHIPQGHSNNIIWNLGHLISAQQNMCYTRSGLPFPVGKKYIIHYLPGTRPMEFVKDEEVTEIKELKK